MRSSTMQQKITVSLAIVAISLYAAPAAAYLDPGTGSMIIQGAIAAVAAAFFTIKLYWYRLKRFFFPDKTIGSDKEKSDSDDAGS